jgi:hypothetical protein
MAVAPASATARVWTITLTPNQGTSGSCLNAVSGAGSGGVWAVGGRSTVTWAPCLQRTLVEHRVHGRWRVVAGPDIRGGPPEVFTDVVALARHNIWAVGMGSGALIEHWNGTAWRRYPTYGGFRLDSIAQVPDTDHLWAVGVTDSVNPRSANLAAYWNGERWRVMAVPAPSFPGGALVFSAVAAVSENDVWAFGGVEGDTGPIYADHWNGERWSRVALPQTAHHLDQLFDANNVPGTTEVWTVGRMSRWTAPGSFTLTEHYADGRWQIVPSPSRGISSQLNSVITIGPDDVWAVGTWTGRQWRTHPLIEHYTQGRWHIVQSHTSDFRTAELLGIAAIPREGRRPVLWAVGDHGKFSQQRTLAMRSP